MLEKRGILSEFNVEDLRREPVTAENFGSIINQVPADISLRVNPDSYDPKKYLEGNGVYSNVDILNALLDGHIIIYPFDPSLLVGSSYDVRVGENFWRTDAIGNSSYYEFLSQEDVDRYFGKPHVAAPNAQKARLDKRFPFRELADDHPVIVMSSGERILAHTNEFIGIRAPGTTEMKAKSTSGRNGVVVCKDAGWGDPGYFNRWTMEIQNDNHEAIAVPVGLSLAQIIFHHTGEVAGDYTQQGSYADTTSLQGLILNWSADSMKPKAKPENVILPDPIPYLGDLAVERETEANSDLKVRKFA